MKRSLVVLFANVMLATVYFLSAKVGLSLASINPSATAVWPPTGIAIASVLILGSRVWPGIWIGAFLANSTTAGSWATSAGIASGNTLEALAAALLVRQFAGGTRAFDRSAGTFRFVLYAAVISTALSASVGVSVLELAGYADLQRYGPIWLTWWLGDAVSALTLAPLLVVWATRRPPVDSFTRALEGLALLAIMVLVGLLQWGPWFVVGLKHYPMGYLVIPPLIWGAFRFRQHGATIVVFAICAIAVWGTLAGRGPFAVADHNTSLLLLQAFVGTMAITGLMISAVVGEHRQVEAVQRESEDRLRQLAESEQAARRQTELASRAKDHFLAVLSHELRTPLTPVLLTVSLLQRRTDLAADLREDLQTIARNVELEARLIDDLLDLTRVARGKLQLSREITDLHAIMIRALEICGRPEGVRVDIDLSASEHIVRGDPARLQQVFWNLLSNAQKFTPAGGTVRVRSSNPKARWIQIEVTDTGVGIDPELLPKLFNAFEQGEEALAKKAGGLGLGLAISRALVVAHGGTLAASSAGKGRGSTFIVDLPTVEQAAGSSSGTPAVSPPSATASRPTSSNRTLDVLLVEDDAPTQHAMGKLLTKMGHRFSAAADVRSALDLARRKRFDLVISDLGLPDGSGHELMRAIRRSYPVRAIALSGYGMEEDVRNSRDAGFAEHLIKPVTLETLEAVIARVADRGEKK